MKRSTWIAAAVAVMSLTLTVESATAQYYHQRPQRHYGGGGGNNNIGAFVAGLVGGAVIGALISSQTRNAMRVASPRMYDLDIEDGYRSEFDGDGHRGYYEVVDQGRTDRYNRCRQIRTVVHDRYGSPVPEYERRRPRCVCLDERNNRWVDINEDEYIPRPIARRPYGSVRVIVRQNEGPMYRPYYGRPTAPIAVARPYYGPVVAPAYGGSRTPHIAGPAAGRPVHRPSGGYAPPVMPYQGAPGVIR